MASLRPPATRAPYRNDPRSSLAHPSEGYAGIVTTLPGLEACDVALRGHLDADEYVLAIGRCEDITERGSIEQGGASRTFIMVTNRRLRWVPYANLEFEASLALDGVTAVLETVHGHRYSIALDHTPLTRPHTVPAHRFLRFQWGNVVVRTPLTRTELAFSRRNTKAALALREQVSLHMAL
jgi:hypothetical protein